MKKLSIFLCLFQLIGTISFAQVGINSDHSAPASSAMLDVKSTNKGFLPPRLSTIQRNSIPSPVAGLVIYNTDCKDLQLYNGGGWIPMGNEGILATPGTITGNASPCANTAGFNYSIAPVANATGYHWTVPSGGVITSGQGTTSITVTIGSNSGVITVAAYNECFRGAVSYKTVTVVQPLPASISITSSGNSVCSGTQVTFTATPVNGGTMPGYQWKKNGTNISGATNVTYTYVPANADAVTCVMTSNASCVSGNPATSNTVNMIVLANLPVSVSIAASGNNICAGTQVTFTATPANGGATPAYQWRLNGSNISGATNVTYAYAPVNNDKITCRLTSSLLCTANNPALSNEITMTVNQILTASVSITASANPVCQGTSVTFTATPTNGGATPAYQWKVNGNSVPGATNSTYSYVPATNNAVTCILTSNAVCVNGNPATSNTVTMTVNQPVTVSVTIAASANPVCVGTQVTLTATPVNGGTTPGYQWKKNGTTISGATNVTYTYAPANTDAITCVLTSNASCINGNPATSNTVNMIVQAIQPVSVSIAASDNNVCAGTQVTFTATPTNGGANPAYQWKVNGNSVSGATNSTYSYAPASNNQVTCILTSNAACISGNPATSNTITMTVNQPVAVSVTIAENANPVCAGTQVTFTATPVNGGTTPGYQWKKNGTNINGATNIAYTYVPANSDAITCVMTSNASCISGNPATSNTVNMIVIANQPVSVSIAASGNNVCEGTQVTFTATPVNGGGNPAYQWKLNGNDINGATNVTYAYTPVNNDKITCRLTSTLLCTANNPALSNEITMTVNPLTLAPTAGTHSATQTEITWNWNTSANATGYKWNITNDYGTATDMGTATTNTETGLTCGTPYTRFVWAYNGCGYSALVTLTQSSLACWICGTSTITVSHTTTGGVAPVNKTTTYGSVTNIAGEATKCWITSNLGSNHQATAVDDTTESSAGWYWQFNRKQGYKHNGSTLTPSWTITSISEDLDWQTANDPCNLELGTQWRIPTYTEWYNVDNTGGWTDWNGPWGSGLKLHAAGYLGYSNGSLSPRGSYGTYWSSTQHSFTNGWCLDFNTGYSVMNNYDKAYGHSVRCLRD